MRKTFKYRIYPSRSQTSCLARILNECRWLYNHLLEQRKMLWESRKESISHFSQILTFKKLKKNRPSLTAVHSQVLQNVSARIDLAFKAFFRRCKKKEKPGYPRFRNKSRYDSFCYPQSGFKIVNDKSVVQLSKIGRVKIILHRPIQGKIKTCTVRRTPTGKWFVSFSCDIDLDVRQQSLDPAIGIDVGLESFATLSDGSKIENPRFFKQEEKTLAKAQRKLSSQKKGSPERRWARKVVARIHERISNKRSNFSHQTSKKLIDIFGLIAIEDLSINKMMKDNFCGINRSIGDVAWGMFVDLLSCKAEWAGKKVIRVNPAYTSQTCSGCGYRQSKKLSDRIHKCSSCGLVLDRDHNAAINILALGQQSLAISLEATGL